METLSNKETALLGLISEEPMHGYQIEQNIEMRSMRYWTEISMSSVYKLLKKLEIRNLIKSKININKRNQTQKIYSLTKLGKKKLKQKIVELISEPEHLRWRVDLGISNLNLLTDREKIKYLKKYEQKLDELVKGYGELLKYLKGENCPEYKLGLATRPVYLFKAEKKWVQDYLKFFV